MTSAEYLRDYNALHNAAGVGVKVRQKHRASPEEDLHRLVFDWIFQNEDSCPILKFAMHVPNGGARSKGEAGKLKALGVRKGVVDVINPFAQPGGAGFACELKAPGGRLTPEQLIFWLRPRQTGG